MEGGSSDRNAWAPPGTRGSCVFSLHCLHRGPKAPRAREIPGPLSCSLIFLHTSPPLQLDAAELTSPIRTTCPLQWETSRAATCHRSRADHAADPRPGRRQGPRPETSASPATGLERSSLCLFTKPDLLKCLYKPQTAVPLFTCSHMYGKCPEISRQSPSWVVSHRYGRRQP